MCDKYHISDAISLYIRQVMILKRQCSIAIAVSLNTFYGQHLYRSLCWNTYRVKAPLTALWRYIRWPYCHVHISMCIIYIVGLPETSVLLRRPK